MPHNCLSTSVCHSTVNCCFWHLLYNIHLKHEDLFIFKGRIFFPSPKVSLLISLLPIPPVTLFCLSLVHPLLHTSVYHATPVLCSTTFWLQPQKLVPFLFLSHLRNLLEGKDVFFRPPKIATADTTPHPSFRTLKPRSLITKLDLTGMVKGKDDF